MKMNLTGKVVLITGGASGIGKACGEEFLRNDVKGIVIADINSDLGEEVTRDFKTKFSQGKVIFIKTDVSNEDSFENAFQKTIEKYKNIDVLINAAGIFDEINWERQINVNLVGTIRGCLLAINKYFPEYKSGSDAYIINLASIAGVIPFRLAPLYASVKHGIIGLTRSLGINETIAKQGVHIMTICPGATETPMLQKLTAETILYMEYLAETMINFSSQKVEVVVRSVMKILSKPENGSVWLINEGVLSKINFPSLEDMISSTQ